MKRFLLGFALALFVACGDDESSFAPRDDEPTSSSWSSEGTPPRAGGQHLTIHRLVRMATKVGISSPLQAKKNPAALQNPAAARSPLPVASLRNRAVVNMCRSFIR